MANDKCPVCRERKPKRMCPALGQMICTVCCATKRLVEIRCPSDCVYLTSAKAHPPAVVQRRQERDLTFLLPLVGSLTEPQSRLMMLLQSVIVRHAEGATPPVHDVDVADAAAALAATLETSRKGIIYEHQAIAVPAQRLTAELRRMMDEVIRQNPSHQARFERDAAAALRQIEEGARQAPKALAGDEPPVYLRLLARILAGQGGGSEAAGEEPASRLIIQP